LGKQGTLSKQQISTVLPYSLFSDQGQPVYFRRSKDGEQVVSTVRVAGKEQKTELR
jgi:hypothetical protein